ARGDGDHKQPSHPEEERDERAERTEQRKRVLGLRDEFAVDVTLAGGSLRERQRVLRQPEERDDREQDECDEPFVVPGHRVARTEREHVPQDEEERSDVCVHPKHECSRHRLSLHCKCFHAIEYEFLALAEVTGTVAVCRCRSRISLCSPGRYSYSRRYSSASR